MISFVDLQVTTLALDFRVTVLEENRGSNGNSSVAELEVRVETLEGTAADHETRISAAETDVNGKYHTEELRLYVGNVITQLIFLYLFTDLEVATSGLDTRLTVAEENIQGKCFLRKRNWNSFEFIFQNKS